MAKLKAFLQLSYSFLTLKDTSKLSTIKLFYCDGAYSSAQQ